MSFIDGLLARFGYIKAGAQRLPDGVTYWDMPDGTRSYSQEQLYAMLSWIHVAVNIVSETGAGATLSIKQRVGEETKDIKNHPFELLLQRPNELQSRFELLMGTFAYRRLTGNAYWWLNRSSENAEPAEIWLIPSHRIRPVPDGRMSVRGYLYMPEDGATEIPLERWEICHFKSFNPHNLYVGLSGIEALADTAIGDIAMRKWNTNYFSKENAKIPGFLAYADPVNDSDWERMKSDMRDNYGGTKRQLMMLRNVGKGGVEWIATSMSQKDMEFLNGRTFNREEIYSVFAPGLSSMLAVNATEANSKTGKASLIELAVWPMLVQAAEKITNDLLPAYGENLVAEFDDIRMSDRAMDLAEQEAYAKSHTVDEIREKFYQDQPIGDERGKLLPVEVGKSTPAKPEDEQQEGEQNGDDIEDRRKRLEQQKPSEDREVAGQEGEPKEPTKAQPPEPSPFEDELKTWERFVLKRAKDGRKRREFESDVIPLPLKAAIEGALDTAGDDVARIGLVFKDAALWEGYYGGSPKPQ